MMKKVLIVILIWISSFNIFGQDYQFFRVDTINSKIFWKCDKHNGIIKLNDGGFITEKNEIIAGLFLINLNSLEDSDLNNQQYGTAKLILENTLKNEFLEIKKYPNAYFKLEKIKQLKNNRYTIKGDFTLHGITNCIEFSATINFEGDKIHLISEKFSIDRTEWGIYRMSPKRPYSDDENGWTVSDTVEIQIDLIAIKE